MLRSSCMASSKPERRHLNFATLDEALQDAQRLVEAERAGTLKQHGNWSLGQTLGHLAGWINFGFEGYPPETTPPLPIRLAMRLLRPIIARSKIPAGVRNVKNKEGTVATEKLSTDEGLARYQAAVRKLNSTAPTVPSPAFGKMSHSQSILMHQRHAELHLSFLSVD